MFGATGDFLEHGIFRSQIVTVLVNVRKFYGGTQLEGSGIGLFFIGNHAEQSSFSGAIGTNQPDHCATGHRESKILDDRFSLLIALAEGVYLNNLFAELRAGSDLDFKRVVFQVYLACGKFFVFVDPAFIVFAACAGSFL